MIQVGLATVALVAVAGCAGIDGTDRGAIRENVIEPGITAINQASELACSNSAAVLRTAMDAYEMLEGSPAPDEATLVSSEYLREESDLWDIVDGQLVPVDPGCGSVPTETADAIDIVTSTEPPPSADEVFAGFTPDQITAVGGTECAHQLADVFAGADRYTAELGREPDTLDEIEAAGYFDAPVTLWQVVDDALVPADGSPCIDVATTPSG